MRDDFICCVNVIHLYGRKGRKAERQKRLKRLKGLKRPLGKELGARSKGTVRRRILISVN